MVIIFLFALFFLPCMRSSRLVDVINYQDHIFSKTEIKDDNFNYIDALKALENIDLSKRIETDGLNIVTICFSFFQYGTENIYISIINETNQIFEIVFARAENHDFGVWNNIDGIFTYYKNTGKAPMWQNVCFMINKEQQTFGIRLNSVALEEKTILNIPDWNSFKVMLGSPSETMTTSVPIKFTLFNVHSQGLNAQTPQCGQPGDIYSWDISEWKFGNNSNNNQNLISEVCQNTVLLKYPTSGPLLKAVTECKRLNGIMPEYEELDEDVLKYHEMEGFFYLPLILENGEYRHLFYNKLVEFNETYWEPNQPNGGSGQPAIMCNSKTCFDIKETSPQGFFCQMGSNVKIRVRGLCPDSKMDKEYTLRSKSNDIMLIGRNSHIRFTDRWELFVHNGKTTGFSSASKESILLGTQNWNFTNDPLCETNYPIMLNFNTCEEEEFNCFNGDCILISKRCDGNYDCQDASDEKDCKIVLKNGNYNPNIGDIGVDDKTEVEVTVEIVSFLSINDKEGNIRIQFKIQMAWKDSRLKYTNLQNSFMENRLDMKIENIWRPQMNYFDTDINKREEHRPATITVRKNNSYIPYQAESSYLHNTLVYEGKYNTLQLDTWLSTTFLCKYDLTYFPFDVQHCKMNFSVTESQLPRIRFVLNALTYNDNNNEVQQFILYRYCIKQDNETKQIVMQAVFSRAPYGFVFTTLLPTVLANIVGHTTNYFEDHFDASIGVNLTIMLVITTMLVEIANSFHMVSGIMLVYLWMVVSLIMPFLEVTLQTWQYNLANRKKLCLAKLKKNKKKLSKKNPEQTEPTLAWNSNIPGNSEIERELVKLDSLTKALSILLMRGLPVLYIVMLIIFLIFGDVHKETRIQNIITAEFQ